MPESTINNAIPDSLKETSLFKGHLLTVKNLEFKPHYSHYDYLPATILFIAFVIFVWLFVSYRKRLTQTIKGFYFNRFANQLAREEFSFGNRVTVFLSFLFLLTLTLFISKTLQYYFKTDKVTSNFLLFNLFVGGSVALIYVVKFIIVKIGGHIFQVQKVASEYIMTLFLYCNSLGLFLLPIVLGISFVKQISPVIFIYIGQFLILFFIVIRNIRGSIIWLKGIRESRFYLFLYLCALEILPFVIMLKLSTLIIK